jgi:hypothetical protein
LEPTGRFASRSSGGKPFFANSNADFALAAVSPLQSPRAREGFLPICEGVAMNRRRTKER